jgi:co-chaperonin GroES (HSP10)
MSNIRAMGNRVIIKQKAASTTTASGIVLQSAQEVPHATVVAVGYKVQGIEPGDTIMVDWSRAGAFEYESVKYHIVIDENVLAVVEE